MLSITVLWFEEILNILINIGHIFVLWLNTVYYSWCIYWYPTYTPWQSLHNPSSEWPPTNSTAHKTWPPDGHNPPSTAQTVNSTPPPPCSGVSSNLWSCRVGPGWTASGIRLVGRFVWLVPVVGWICSGLLFSVGCLRRGFAWRGSAGCFGYGWFRSCLAAVGWSILRDIRGGVPLELYCFFICFICCSKRCWFRCWI